MRGKSTAPRRALRPRTLVALLAAAVVLALLLRAGQFLSGIDPLRFAPQDSWSYAPHGFRALQEILTRLGFSAPRWTRSYHTLPAPAESVLLVLDPDERARPRGENAAVAESQVAALKEWVEAGGRIILTMPGAAVWSIAGVDVRLSPPEADHQRERWASFHGLFAGLGDLAPTTADAGSVRRFEHLEGRGFLAGFSRTMEVSPEDAAPPRRRALEFFSSPGEAGRLPHFGAGAPADALGDFRPVLALDGRWVAVEKPLGHGELIAFSTPFFFSNGALHDEPFATAALRVLYAASDEGRRRIIFDEYAHGVVRRGGVLRWAWETALFFPLGTALVAIALVAWQGVVRFGPPTPERQLPRRAKEEFVISLAELYRRGAHHGHALSSIARAYDQRLETLLGRPPPTRFGHKAQLHAPPTTAEDLFRRARLLHDDYREQLRTLAAEAPRVTAS